MAPTLYWMSGSAPCWKAMLTMEECGFKYEDKLLSMAKGESKTPEMLALNPRGQLPVFVDGDTIVNESLGICLYVIGQSGNKTLLPDGPTKALALQRFFEVTNVGSVVSGLYFLMRAKELSPEDQKKKEENGEKLSKELKLWDTYLEKKDYLAGDSFTVADCSFYPHLAFLVRIGLLLEDNFPNLKRYYDTVSKRPSVTKTWPPEWTGDNKTVLNFIK